MLALTILGNNSALSAHGRHPTAQVLQTQDTSYLIDCGEGTQNQLSLYKIKRSRIKSIFISHLHGDHYFGLIGLLSSMGLLGRKDAIQLFGPAPLMPILNLQLEAAGTVLPYEIIFHALGEEGEIANDNKMSISAFKVNHRIDCWGFLFVEKKKARKLDIEQAKLYQIPSSFYGALQDGQDYQMKKGTIVANEDVTTAARAPLVYAYCADTKFDHLLPAKVRGATLIYHESTYLKDQEEKAESRYHSTAEQAAKTALAAGAKKLLIGHFSSKYKTLEEFLCEAQEIFPNTDLALEGCTYIIADLPAE